VAAAAAALVMISADADAAAPSAPVHHDADSRPLQLATTPLNAEAQRPLDAVYDLTRRKVGNHSTMSPRRTPPVLLRSTTARMQALRRDDGGGRERGRGSGGRPRDAGEDTADADRRTLARVPRHTVAVGPTWVLVQSSACELQVMSRPACSAVIGTVILPFEVQALYLRPGHPRHLAVVRRRHAGMRSLPMAHIGTTYAGGPARC
jgi:hypothetical protein